MKEKNHKKIIVASALIAGLATTGGATALMSQSASATTNRPESISEADERPELSEGQKAELDEKLANMTEEEKKEWLESHKPEGGNPPELGERPEGKRPKGERPELGERPEKPADTSSDS